MQCTDLIYRVAQKIVSYRTLSVSSLNIDHFHNFLPVDSVRNLLLILDSNRHTENPRFRLSDLHYVRLLQIFKKMLNAHCHYPCRSTQNPNTTKACSFTHILKISILSE